MWFCRFLKVLKGTYFKCQEIVFGSGPEQKLKQLLWVLSFTDKLCLKGARSLYMRRLNNEAIVLYIE